MAKIIFVVNKIKHMCNAYSLDNLIVHGRITVELCGFHECKIRMDRDNINFIPYKDDDVPALLMQVDIKYKILDILNAYYKDLRKRMSEPMGQKQFEISL